MGRNVTTAFVAGAGLGTRLRPLTERRPKPLVPVFNQLLITRVFDALIDIGIRRVVVNTHHCPQAYDALLGLFDGTGSYRSLEIECLFEPVLLETGGGIRNAEPLFRGEPVLVHNGDVLSRVDLAGLLDAHSRSRAEVTAHLRSFGGPLQVGYDPEHNRITDFRGALGAPAGMACLFSGMYVLEPEFISRIPAGEIISVVPVFLDMLRAGEGIAGFLDDSGLWADVGNREAYLDAHAQEPHRVEIAPSAVIGDGVEFSGFVAIGPRAIVGDGASIRNSVVWNDAKIASGARLERCIVRDHQTAVGTLRDVDV